ncbi:thioredoxin-dependent thiol peroxidase [Ahniella affigens]|uniref:thioredoxin-dependent peroxiredoxin n=1 Tax=Ahniella affigens TaxID=2021234 RepID=A0A2P1PXB4_9GAMM|nr:thioredoxin-dependent thiol peroxidase [Ahniella affigens]AVP99489.1 thioredoxin-dependent thiol peroxidase [Ahniella affigens]
MLTPGSSIPDFALSTQSGQTVSKASLKGKRFVLYFYPKDSTPACTTQACGIRDAHPDFQKLGVPVFGVSADDVKSHQKFADKQALNFPLLADPDRVLIEGLGAWGEKSLYGRKYLGIFRCTFVVDAGGKVEQVWPKVDVKTHAADVLRYLQGGAGTEPAPTGKKAPAKTSGSAKPAAKVATRRQSAAKPITKKPAVKKPAAKKSAVKKPVATKRAASKTGATKPAATKLAAKRAKPKSGKR